MVVIPCLHVSRACPNIRSVGSKQVSSANHAQNVAFLHDDQVFALELDLGARPFAEQDPVARLDVERGDLAVLAAGAGADSDDFAFLRLLLDRVGDDYPAGGLFLGLDAADQHAIVQGDEMSLCGLSIGGEYFGFLGRPMRRKETGTLSCRVPMVSVGSFVECVKEAVLQFADVATKSKTLGSWVRPNEKEWPTFWGTTGSFHARCQLETKVSNGISVADEWTKLTKLRNEGVITDQEFSASKGLCKMIGVDGSLEPARLPSPSSSS